MLDLVKRPVRAVLGAVKTRQAEKRVTALLADQTFSVESFDFEDFRAGVLGFMKSMQADESGVQYRYSASSRKPTLYSSAYACMTLSLLDAVESLSAETRHSWAEYFDSFQRDSDGLFYDPVVAGRLFDQSDWWGARHLALHMISAYTVMGRRPKYPFTFLDPYCDLAYLESWLDGYNWLQRVPDSSDFDNKLMNIGGLLQYRRDFWGDQNAGDAVTFIQQYLYDKINPESSMWGSCDALDLSQHSRMVQFAYHLFQIYFYDEMFDFDADKVSGNALSTQNTWGGFGVKPNSSACEDIDSIDILIRLASRSLRLAPDIRDALEKGFAWVVSNQTHDGGLVFRRHEKLRYGHVQLSEDGKSGGMLPTWFRTLTVVYLARYFDVPGNYRITRCPGYEF